MLIKLNKIVSITVKQLIRHLKKLPPDAICISTNNNTMEQSGDSPISKPQFYSTGSVKRIETIDAFDGTPYNYDRYSIVGGKLKVVKF